MPLIVRWWWAPEPPGSATAKPANSITTSEGIGMQAEPSAISRNTAGRPPSRTRCQVAVTTDSVTEARTSTGASTISGYEGATGQGTPGAVRIVSWD